MAKRAETLQEPQGGWGRASRVAQGSVLAILLGAGTSVLLAEPLDSDAARTYPSSITLVRTNAGAVGQTLSVPQKSVSAFSATQSDAARVLLAQELNGESNRTVGRAPFPAAPQSAAAPRTGEAQVRVEEAAEAKDAEESAMIVGRSLRAYTRGEEQSEESSPRRRASFSSAISRAAAAGALTSTNPNASVGTSLNSARFTPGGNFSEFDPGFSKAAEVLSIVPGLQLESATIFGGYSSNAMPRSFTGASPYGVRSQNLGSDYDLGASAVISYGHEGRRSSTRFSYAPSHVQRSRIPEWSTTDHRFSFSTSRDLTPRLSLRSTANAGNSGIEQFWTRPAVIRTVDAPASFAELMSKVLSGEISDDEFAAILTGSRVVDDPGGNEQDLSRIFSASVGTSASYAYSRRMTINFGASASMNRRLSDDIPNLNSLRYLNSARTTNGSVSANYRLSSRTSLSFRHVSSFSDSTFASSVAHTPTVGLSQTLSRHWTYQVNGGIGLIHFDPTKSLANISGGTTWTANGSVGYLTGAHQIHLSAGRQVGDPMGFGSRSTAQASLMWNWQPRFTPWGANAGVSFSRSAFGSGSQLGREFMSDLYSAGLSRRLTPSTTFRSDYYFGEYVSPFSGLTSNMAVHRLQMSLMWRPVEQR